MADPEAEEAEMAVELETRCDIDLNAAREEASWYSIMNVFALTLGSGMGIPLGESDVNSMLGEVGLCLADMPIKNPALLQAFFKNGDPHLMKQFELWNLDSWRWKEDDFDKELVPQAQGWSIISEVECAKWFGIPEKQTAISSSLRKDWMTYGLLLSSLARKQCEFAFDNLRNDQGLFVTSAQPGSVTVTDQVTNLTDQVCMLWACSDLISLLGREGTVFANEEAREKALHNADGLFEAILNHKDALLEACVNSIQARSVTVPALVWYASVTEAQDLKARCLWLIREYADELVKAKENNEMVGNNLIDAAAALRALSEAFRVTRLRTYADSAVDIFNFIESQWWKLPGLYSPSPMSDEYTFNVDDIGTILGALNSSQLFLKDRVNRGLAELRMRIFFCNAVNLSGLEMSMPSMDFLPDWLQQREPSIHFRHGTIPLPSQAGGDFGIASVFAGEVGYDPHHDVWSRRMLFDAAGAMHACAEFLWLNHEAINGFPEISLENAPLTVRQAAGVAA